MAPFVPGPPEGGTTNRSSLPQKKPVPRGNGLKWRMHDHFGPSREGARQLASLGILTSGSTYSPRPSHSHVRIGTVTMYAAFVPSHSGGAVLDSHQLPSFCYVLLGWIVPFSNLIRLSHRPLSKGLARSERYRTPIAVSSSRDLRGQPDSVMHPRTNVLFAPVHE